MENGDIRTTINVRLDLYEKLLFITEKTGLHINQVMTAFIEKMIDELFADDSFKERAVKYQSPAPHWEHPHISLTQIQYDRYLDIKKVYRFSLSFILGMALEKFDESIFETENKDSYPEYFYHKSIKLDNTMRIYTFIWEERGKTEEPPG